MPQYQKAVEKSQVVQALTTLKALVQAQEVYYLANGEYATKFTQLDVNMSGWTGKTKWSTTAISDTRSNGEWSLQIFNNSSGSTKGNALYMGRINGPYKGIGIMYWFDRPAGDAPLKSFVCKERTSDGVRYEGESGSYCRKILGGIQYEKTTARHYLLSY